MPTVPYSGERSVAPTGTETRGFEGQRIEGISGRAFGGGDGDGGLGRALYGLGEAIMEASGPYAERQRKQQEYEAEVAFQNWTTGFTAQRVQLERDIDPSGNGYVQAVTGTIDPQAKKFLESLPNNDLAGKYAPRVANFRGNETLRALDYQRKQQDSYVRTTVKDNTLKAAQSLNDAPEELSTWQQNLEHQIDLSALPEAEKDALKKTVRSVTQGTALKATVRKNPSVGQSGEDQLVFRESRGRASIINSKGYAGLYQFGAPRLNDLGLFVPAVGEDITNATWSKVKGGADKWNGTFHIPGFSDVKTIQDFLSNPDAQREAWRIHKEDIEKTILDNGWQRFIGQTIQGVEVTHQGLINGVHLGGPGGMAKFLAGTSDESDGRTKISDYMRMASSGNADLLRTDPRWSDLTPDQIEAAIRDGETESVQRRNEQRVAENNAKQQQFNDFAVGVFDGRLGWNDYLAARETWLDDINQIQQIENIITAGNKKKFDLSSALTDWKNAESGGYFYSNDERSKKGLELIHDAYDGTTRIGKMDQTYVDQVLAPMSERARSLPEGAVKALNAAAHDPSNPQRMNWAYQNLYRLRMNAPNALPETLDKEVNTYKELVLDGNFTPEYFHETRVKAQSPAEQKSREALAKEATEGKGAPFKDWSLNDTLAQVGGTSTDDLPPAQRGQMTVEREAIYKEYIRDGLNHDQAVRATNQSMARTWGKTEVGAAGVSKYPVEKTYNAVQGDHEWIEQQVQEVMRAGGIATFPGEREFARGFFGTALTVGMAFLPGFNAIAQDRGLMQDRVRPYFLRSDDRTAIDVANNRPASYELYYMDGNGGFQKYVDPNGNDRIRFNERQFKEKAKQDPVFNAYENELKRKRERQNLYPWGKVRGVIRGAEGQAEIKGGAGNDTLAESDGAVALARIRMAWSNINELDMEYANEATRLVNAYAAVVGEVTPKVMKMAKAALKEVMGAVDPEGDTPIEYDEYNDLTGGAPTREETLSGLGFTVPGTDEPALTEEQEMAALIRHNVQVNGADYTKGVILRGMMAEIAVKASAEQLAKEFPGVDEETVRKHLWASVKQAGKTLRKMKRK